MDDLGSDAISNGPWQYNPRTGSKVSGLYLRAAVSLTGLLALNQSEAIYFQADRDSDGRPLQCANTYEVQIPALATRWWSITAYDEDFFLIPNQEKRYGFSSADLSLKSGETAVLILSSSPHNGNWVPLGKGQTFSLTLRLYNPTPELRAHLRDAQLPRIVRQ